MATDETPRSKEEIMAELAERTPSEQREAIMTAYRVAAGVAQDDSPDVAQAKLDALYAELADQAPQSTYHDPAQVVSADVAPFPTFKVLPSIHVTGQGHDESGNGFVDIETGKGATARMTFLNAAPSTDFATRVDIQPTTPTGTGVDL